MSGRIYCGRLPTNAAEKDLESLLKSFGKIRDIDFKEGYAYAVFKDYNDADKAVQELNGKEFMGQNILVERAKDIRNGVGGYTIAGGYTARVRQPKPPPVRTNFRIRVENLPARAKWSELKEFMSVAGDVTFADTHRRRPGEGVVEFANKSDMIHALDTLDKQEFLGKKIRLVEETPRSTRERSLSRSRSLSPPPKRKRHSSSPSLSQSKGRRSHSRDRSKSPERSTKNQSYSASPSRSSRRRSRSRSLSNYKSTSHSSRRKRSHSKSPRRSRHRSRSKSNSKSKGRSERHSSSKDKLHKKKKRKSRSHSRSKSPRRRR